MGRKRECVRRRVYTLHTVREINRYTDKQLETDTEKENLAYGIPYHFKLFT